MSVKDVLQSLVDDAMVDSDRIGTSNYFWAFPSKASNIVSIQIEKLALIYPGGYSNLVLAVVCS